MKKLHLLKLTTAILFLLAPLTVFSSMQSPIEKETIQSFAGNKDLINHSNAYIGILANSLCIDSLNKPENANIEILLKNLIKQCKSLQNNFYSILDKKRVKRSENKQPINTFEEQEVFVNAAENSIDILELTQLTLLALDKATLLVKPDKLYNLKMASYYCYAVLESAKLTAEKNIKKLTSKEAGKRLNDRIAGIMNKSLTLHDSITDEIQMQKVLDNNNP